MFCAINAFQMGVDWDLKFVFAKSSKCCSSSENLKNLIICVELKFIN